MRHRSRRDTGEDLTEARQKPLRRLKSTLAAPGQTIRPQPDQHSVRETARGLRVGAATAEAGERPPRPDRRVVAWTGERFRPAMYSDPPRPTTSWSASSNRAPGGSYVVRNEEDGVGLRRRWRRPARRAAAGVVGTAARDRRYRVRPAGLRRRGWARGSKSMRTWKSRAAVAGADQRRDGVVRLATQASGGEGEACRRGAAYAPGSWRRR